ncbi:uncharacterized protein PV09_07588 [Verruconis gallopava]|uniref:Ferritin-like domain-containing protein n=1 Tax=Verruconis gallopava TaxID=253628 RepID=A0A0D2A237_9PEZI|nr:uncharacterized protein PV09_07588 [Verruconis gallopava]KIW00828.1 hypothetical protein PV09_07588 [Verruconis gallopava]
MGSCDIQTAEAIPTSILPESISSNTLDNIQALLFVEHLESSFFTAAAANFSNWDTSNALNDSGDIIARIADQEQTHVRILQSMIDAYDIAPIRPCNYSFPVNSWNDFIFVAQRLTTVGMSALIGLSGELAETDPGLVSSLSSILTVEARHDAFLLLEEQQIPNPQAFDTIIHMLWAQNFALQYVIPGSCPDGVPLPVLPMIQAAINSTQHAQEQADRRIDFSWDVSQMPFVVEAGRPLTAAWVGQDQEPTYTNITIDGVGKGHTDIPSNITGQVFTAITSRQPKDEWSLEWAALSGPALVDLA